MAHRVVVLDHLAVVGVKSPALLSILSSRPPLGACSVVNIYVQEGKFIVEYDDTPRTQEGG